MRLWMRFNVLYTDSTALLVLPAPVDAHISNLWLLLGAVKWMSLWTLFSDLCTDNAALYTVECPVYRRQKGIAQSRAADNCERAQQQVLAAIEHKQDGLKSASCTKQRCKCKWLHTAAVSGCCWVDATLNVVEIPVHGQRHQSQHLHRSYECAYSNPGQPWSVRNRQKSWQLKAG